MAAFALHLALAVVASLFAARHGFQEQAITEEDRKELDLISGAFRANSDASREERQIRLWINSLGIELVHGKGAAPEPLVVADLFEDLRSGHALVAVADTVVDGLVRWKKVNRKKKLNRFRQIENCNYVLELSRKMGLTVVNIGAFDIVDANQKLILGLLWQYMRYHTLRILASLYKIEGRDAVDVLTSASGVYQRRLTERTQTRDLLGRKLYVGPALRTASRDGPRLGV